MVTYTDLEVAHAGLTEDQARKQFGGKIEVHLWPMKKVDRAACENDLGFIKVITSGVMVGATIVAARAGEAISEIVLGIKNGWRLKDIASAIHAYRLFRLSALIGTRGAFLTSL